MSCFRHEEIYRSDGEFLIDGKPTEAGSPDHRLDESPAGFLGGLVSTRAHFCFTNRGRFWRR